MFFYFIGMGCIFAINQKPEQVKMQENSGISSMIINAYGDQEWYQNGKLHRDGDLPAYIGADGTQMWYHNGNLHRDSNDQPAMITASGTQKWYRYGNLYRTNGNPAIIRADGTLEWYCHGIQLTEKEAQARLRTHVNRDNRHKIVFMFAVESILPFDIGIATCGYLLHMVSK